MRDRSRRSRGSALLEALIAAAILLTVLALAAELLAESGRRLAFEIRRTREPIGHALALLEADVRLSAEVAVVSDPDGPWPALRLDGHPAGTVLWRRSLGQLVRRVSGGGRSGESLMLRGVRTFDLAVSAGDLVTVDLEVERRVLVGGLPWRPNEELRRERVRAVASPRGELLP